MSQQRTCDFILLGMLLLFQLLRTECHVAGQEKHHSDPLPEAQLTAAQERYCQDNNLFHYAQAALKWKEDADLLSKTNASDGDSSAILCLGSSSFRLWDSIETDMAPYKIIRRAYGGAKYCDLAIHTPQLIRGLTFGKVMIFVGNDITGKEEDKTPEEIVRLSKLVMDSLRRESSSIPIYLIAVTPTPSRFQHWPKIREANRQLEVLAMNTEHTFFVTTETAYLNAQNEPRSELFREDNLHQNELGYAIWSSILKRFLAEPIIK